MKKIKTFEKFLNEISREYLNKSIANTGDGWNKDRQLYNSSRKAQAMNTYDEQVFSKFIGKSININNAEHIINRVFVNKSQKIGVELDDKSILFYNEQKNSWGKNSIDNTLWKISPEAQQLLDQIVETSKI
jgi:hypothetical protein